MTPTAGIRGVVCTKVKSSLLHVLHGRKSERVKTIPLSLRVVRWVDDGKKELSVKLFHLIDYVTGIEHNVFICTITFGWILYFLLREVKFSPTETTVSKKVLNEGRLSRINVQNRGFTERVCTVVSIRESDNNNNNNNIFDIY